jgi:hypothetical protein
VHRSNCAGSRCVGRGGGSDKGSSTKKSTVSKGRSSPTPNGERGKAGDSTRTAARAAATATRAARTDTTTAARAAAAAATIRAWSHPRYQPESSHNYAITTNRRIYAYSTIRNRTT